MELVQADIDAYLATKHADDVIGERFNSRFCLLSESLHHKYPDYEWQVDCFTVLGLSMESPGDEVSFTLSEDVRALEVTFDLLPGAASRVTKAVWLAQAEAV